MGIRDTVRRVRSKGDEDRKTVQLERTPRMPRKDSPLYGVYYRWCHDTGRPADARVGICHFWHVVLILVPLRKLGQMLSRTFGLSFLASLSVLAVVAGIEVLFGTAGKGWLTVPTFVFALANVSCFIAGLVVYSYLHVEDEPLMDVLEDIISSDAKMSWGIALALAGGPAFLVAYTLSYFIHNTIHVILRLRVYRFAKDNILVVGPIVGTVVIAVLCYLYASSHGWKELLIVVGTIFGGVLAAGLLFIAIVYASQSANQKRLSRKAAQRRQMLSLIEAGESLPKSRENIFKRAWRTVVSAVRTVWDVVVLVAEAVRYGYKKICHIVELPPDPYQDTEAEAA